VTLEASASGLPVITSRFNGAAELMTDGKEGSLLDDPSNAPTLARLMERFLPLRAREELGTAGRLLAENHTFEEQTAQFVQLYEEIAVRKRTDR
jgi:UDP-glucose:(heptosyl)LPS alpha-1,3-glucosyltransferase